MSVTQREQRGIEIGEPYQALPIAAPTAAGLAEHAARLATVIASEHTTELSRLASSLWREPAAPHRRIVFARDWREAVDALSMTSNPITVEGVAASAAPMVGFLFAGPSQDPALNQLYEQAPAFRRGFDACAAIGMELFGWDLAHALEASPRIETPKGLALLFAIEYALCEQWAAVGVRPSIAMGYSFGELVAATVSGVFDLRDGFTLAVARAHLLQEIPAGTMTSVGLTDGQVRPMLRGETQIAIQRSPRSCVISGPVQEMKAFEEELRSAQIPFQRLDLPIAGHSRAAARVAHAFAQKVARVARRLPHTQLVSNVTGKLITGADVMEPEYWGSQLAQTVRFADGLQSMLAAGCQLLVEIGPGHHLTALASQQLPRGAGLCAVPTLRPVIGHTSARLSWLRALAKLWTLGVPVDWSRTTAVA